MLKTDLHLHVKEDPEDYKKIRYTAKELINRMVKMGYEVISITGHNYVFGDKIREYADKKGLLFIPGVEMDVEGKHVLVYNVNNKDIDKIKTFSDLRKMRKKKELLVVAPHPFFVFKKCLGRKLEKNIDCFDAIEYNAFFTKWLDLNKKSVKLAEKYNKTMVASSDAHSLFQLGKTYSLVKSKRKIKDVFKAIRENKVELVRKPLNFIEFLRVIFKIVFK